MILLAAALLAAHFLRRGDPGLALAWLLLPGLLLTRWRWTLQVVRLALLGGALVWLDTLASLLRIRLALGAPWLTLVLILGAVVLVTLIAALFAHGQALSRFCARGERTALTSTATFLLTLLLLAIVQESSFPMLILERFFRGGGWVEALLLASYAAWITEKLAAEEAAPRWRRRIWLLFSLLFFAQLALGLAGLDRFLMHPDRLHWPIPALIVAGPLYRGGGLFMLLLLLSTLILVGPAWCSHLCYLGSWDELAASRRQKPGRLPRWAGAARLVILVLILGTAILLHLLEATPLLAGALALGLGLTGVAVIGLWSRRAGLMTHCTVFCPISLVATTLGRLSPFRLAIGAGCDGCQRCRLACRYGALEERDLTRRRPGARCTLCGDCLAACPGREIGYRFPGLDAARSRALFLVLVVSLHAATLGLARV